MLDNWGGRDGPKLYEKSLVFFLFLLNVHALLKKENKIFSYIRKFKRGSDAKSYLTNCLLLIYTVTKYLSIFAYKNKSLFICDFAPDPF
jgi:hypothetical protein